MPEPQKLRVFLCHSSQDKPVVRELYQRLHAEKWIDPWLDEEKLLPGQNWDMEIEMAVELADAVIVCLSNNSVTKEGYVQREIKFVLDIALEKPEGAIFVIPLRLHDVQPPRRLRSWQYVDYFPKENKKWAWQRLIQALHNRFEQVIQTKVQDVESNNDDVELHKQDVMDTLKDTDEIVSGKQLFKPVVSTNQNAETITDYHSIRFYWVFKLFRLERKSIEKLGEPFMRRLTVISILAVLPGLILMPISSLIGGATAAYYSIKDEINLSEQEKRQRCKLAGYMTGIVSAFIELILSLLFLIYFIISGAIAYEVVGLLAYATIIILVSFAFTSWGGNIFGYVEAHRNRK